MKKIKNKQKSKGTLNERFIEFYLQTRLICENQFVNLNQQVIYIIIICSIIQETSFLLLAYATESIEKQISLSTFIYEISSASRIRIRQDKEFREICYIIPLCIVTFYQILLLILFTFYINYNKKQWRMYEFLKSQNRLIQIILKLYSYFHSLMYYLFIIPLLEFSFISLYENAKADQINLVHLSFSIITIIIVIINYLLQLLCNLESISIKPKNLQFLQTTFSNYWKSLCNLIIIIINQMNGSQITKFYLIFSIILVKQVSMFWALFQNYPNLFCKLSYEVRCNCFQITFSLILFVNQVSEQKSNYHDFLSVLIIVPIIDTIFHNWLIRAHEYLILSDSYRLNAEMLQYKIANILFDYGNLQYNYLQNTEKITFLIHFKQKHLENCEESKCICRKQLISFEDTVILYLKDLVKLFDDQIKKTKDDNARQSFFLHYLSLINYLGLNTKAFQQSNFIAQLDSESYQYSSSATHRMNYQFSSQRQEKKEIQNSSDGKSHSIQNQKSQVDKNQQTSNHLKIGNVGMFNRQKITIIQDVIKQSMSMGFSKQSLSFSESLEHAVKLFLQSEENNKKLRNKVIKMINRKREFFNNLNSQTIDFSIYDRGKRLLIQMNKLEDSLYKLYDKFPSQKMQALNAFYQSEIMNNYSSAFKIATIASISDEKLLKMQFQTNFDLFSNKIDYLIIGFDKQTHKLGIRTGSNLINKLFGLTIEQYKLIKSIDHLIPTGFEQIHDKLVANFLQFGESKYFRQINLNFCQFQHKFIKPIDFFYDINFMNLDDLTFACFLQSIETKNAYIFCLQNHKIAAVTRNLASKIGYSNRIIKELAQSFNKVHINRVFPKINLILEANLTKASDINPELLETTEISEYSMPMNIPQQIFLENNQKINWDNIDHINTFGTDCVLHLRNFKSELNYIIIEIKEIKKTTKTDPTIPEQQMTIGLGLQTGQEEFDSFSAYELENEELEFAVNLPKAIELFGLEQQQTANLDNLDNIDFEHFHNIESKFKMKDQSIQYQQPSYNQSMISPKDSGLRLIENKDPDFNQNSLKVRPNEKQQFFISAEQIVQEEFSSSFQQSSQVKQQQLENQIDKMQFDDIDQELQENIKMQMQMDIKEQKVVHIDDIGSQVSSIAGLKKSKYSKKYDLVDKLINSVKFSKRFKLMLLFFTMMVLLFITFSGVMLYFSNDDLDRFLQELDLIQIESNIIGPVNKYVVSQNALTNYIILTLLYPNITFAAQAVKMQYSVLDINSTYYELKQSFSTQLSNPYLNPFFEDKYFQIMVGQYPKTKNYTISARESLYLYLEACYNFLNINYFKLLTLDFTQGFLVFLYGNYQTFVQELQILNKEMTDYSIDRSYVVSTKWNILLIPILLISFLMKIISFTFYKNYLNQYDDFLQLFSYIDNVWLQRDIDRYRGIASLLLKDTDVLFKYSFDIDIKEKFLAAEDIRKEKIATNQKSSKQRQNKQMNSYNLKLSFLPSLFLFTFIFGICFIFCFITNSLGRSYFQKYPATTSYFNSLSDLSIAVSGQFSMREVIYIQRFYAASNVFYFLPDKNATFFVSNFFDQITVINNFFYLIAEFDSEKYITSDDFVTQMELMMSTDLCQFLPKEKLELSESHCDILYQGVLRRGFLAAATTIRDSLLNEYEQTKGFSLRTYQLQEELEAGLIMYDTISSLKLKFQEQLISSTNELQTQILVINLIFIGILVFSLLITFSKILQYFKWEFNLMKRFILLLPQQSLFLDNQLDRTIRQMVVKEQLI